MAEKATKAEAEYQDGPHGKDCCGNCTMYTGNYSCTSVKGRVAPEGWCEYHKLDRSVAASTDAILGGR